MILALVGIITIALLIVAAVWWLDRERARDLDTTAATLPRSGRVWVEHGADPRIASISQRTVDAQAGGAWTASKVRKGRQLNS